VELKRKNKDLRTQLAHREEAIKVLTKDQAFLQQELNYFTRRSRVLEKEKQARLEAAGILRQGIRNFTDNVMDTLRSYYQKTEIVDYLGSELYRRARLGDEKNQLLVDLQYPLKSDGTLVGGSAYLAAPTQFVFCLLRHSKPGQYTVVRMSDPISSEKTGLQSWTFQVPLAGRKGDLMGIFFPGNIPVPFDDADTGNVVLVPGPVQLNSTVSIKPPETRNKRAYSFGMSGFLGK
jgi:hypothetical protein